MPDPAVGAGHAADGRVRREPPDQARLRQIADEQAALRRVATLVARGAAPEEVFTAVAGEVGQLLPVDQAALCRYEPDGTLTFVSQWGRVTAIGTPIIVEDRLWGTISVASQREQSLPADAEACLVTFTELAAAIANAGSRAELMASRADRRGGGRDPATDRA
jgi:GAF domain-containing protein